MLEMELQLLRFLIGLRSPLMDSLMLNLTVFGSIVFVAVLGVVLYRFDKFLSRKVLASGILSFSAAHLLKLLFKRPRPPVEILVQVSSYAFPSGHAAVSFGVATILSRKTGWKFFYLIAGLVGISRLYLGAHYPTDVIAGALLGYLAGLTTEKVEEKTEILERLQSSIHGLNTSLTSQTHN